MVMKPSVSMRFKNVMAGVDLKDTRNKKNVFTLLFPEFFFFSVVSFSVHSLKAVASLPGMV